MGRKTTDISLPDMMKNLILSLCMTRKIVAWKLSEISHDATFINRPGSGTHGIKFWRKIRKNLTVVMCGSLFSVLSCSSCIWRQAIGWPISARNSPFGNPRISTMTWKSNNLNDLRSNKNQIINESWSKFFFCKTLKKGPPTSAIEQLPNVWVSMGSVSESSASSGMFWNFSWSFRKKNMYQPWQRNRRIPRTRPRRTSETGAAQSSRFCCWSAGLSSDDWSLGWKDEFRNLSKS